jgi:hypothetical protein
MKHAARSWIRRRVARRCARSSRGFRRIMGRAFLALSAGAGRRDTKLGREGHSFAQVPCPERMRRDPQHVLGSPPSSLVQRLRFRGSPAALCGAGYPSTLSSRSVPKTHVISTLHFFTRQNSDTFWVRTLLGLLRGLK